MADSTVADISKMKVVELRKELKARGLPHTGDKVELVSRLQSAISQDQDENADINLDSDEIDSDGVLEDDDDKSQEDIVLDDSAVEQALAEQPAPEPAPAPKEPESKPPRTLKRKFINKDSNGEKSLEQKSENKESGGKKIILNRSTSIATAIQSKVDTESKEEKEATEVKAPTESNKVKITADLDLKTRMEMRAKRFGLPVKSSDEELKEARKMRFKQGSATSNSITSGTPAVSENLDKLKKRAERFGQSVSKIMSDIELKEKIEKRKAKFGVAQ